MTVIKLIAADQKLITVQNPIVASGNVESVIVEVEFDSVWNEYVRSAIFFTLEDPTVYEQILVDDSCTIPHETMKTEGTLFIGMRGIRQNGSIKTTHLLKYKIEKGSPVGTETSEPPTESVYMRLVGTVENIQNEVLEFTARTEQQQAEFMQNANNTIAEQLAAENAGYENLKTEMSRSISEMQEAKEDIIEEAEKEVGDHLSAADAEFRRYMTEILQRQTDFETLMVSGYLPISGGTLTGALTVIDNFNINKTFDDVEYMTYVRPTNYALGDEYTTGLIHYINGVNNAQLVFNRSGVLLRDNVAGKASLIYGQHNVASLRSESLNRETKVNAHDTNYTTFMARGTSLNSADTTPTANGCVAWTYK